MAANEETLHSRKLSACSQRCHIRTISRGLASHSSYEIVHVSTLVILTTGRESRSLKLHSRESQIRPLQTLRAGLRLEMDSLCLEEEGIRKRRDWQNGVCRVECCCSDLGVRSEGTRQPPLHEYCPMYHRPSSLGVSTGVWAGSKLPSKTGWACYRHGLPINFL